MIDDSWLPTLWSLIFVVILGVWSWLIYRLYGGLMSKHWLKVSAKITRSEVKRETVFGFGMPKQLTYPEIAFKYLVNGKWYTSKNFSFSLLRPAADEVVEKYPLNALVRVVYHPLLPGLAVLDPGLPLNEALFLAFCFVWTSVMVIAGGWLIYSNWL
ncbi:MAG: DUF3592 domain-containing protein [Anaerolineales bacterium]|nr:DUF3592 domain-containing protein [Anaerolineales bacterium]